MAGFFDSLQNNNDSSEEEFLKEQLAGSAPQYDPEGGWNTAKNIGKMVAEMTTPGALAEAAGYMGDPSLFQNIGSGDYGSAALQAAGLIPGIGWVGKAGKLGKAARAAEVVPPSAMREIGATPRGWDIAVPRRAAPVIEGSVSETDPFFGVRRADRTSRPKTGVFREPRLNPYDDPYAFGLEENAFRSTSKVPSVMAEEPVLPKTRLAENYVSNIPLEPYTNYSPRISGEMNPNVADLLRRLRAENAAPNRFEQAMIDRYYSGRPGQANIEAMANMPVSVIPRGIQRTLANVSEQNRPMTSLERANLKKHFAGRTGLQSRAALSNQQMREAIYGPQAQFRQAMTDEMAATPEMAPVAESGRASLVRKALNIASGVGPRVGAGMVAGGLGGMGEYLASRALSGGPAAPVIPVADREERRPVAPRTFTEFPMASVPMGTDFESPINVATERTETPAPAAAPVRPAAGGEKRAAPVRKATAPVRRPVPKRAAPARAARSSQRYYGDWRDAEPFASDPIGGFIDELTGRTRQSTRKGSLGDLGYDKGGSVRRPFADGGTEDRIPILSDIGDALGGLFEPSEGGERVVAEDREPTSSAKNFFEDWSTNPLSQFLFAAGLGTMASDRVNPLQAVGEGGLRGLEYMQAVSANQQALRREREAAAERRKQLEYIRGIIGGSGEAPAETPVKTSTAEPEVSAPTEKPIKVAGAELAPETATTEKEPVVSAPAKVAPAAPVVAEDRNLKNLYSVEDKLTRALASITDPQARQTASAALQSVKSRINRIEKEKTTLANEEYKRQQLKIWEKNAAQRALEHDPQEIAKREALVEAVKSQPKKIEATNSLAEQAKNVLTDIEIAEKGYENKEIYNLPSYKEAMKSLKGGLREVGWWEAYGPSAKKIQASEAVERLGVKDLLKQIGGSLGHAISDADRAMIERMSIGLDKSKETNLYLMGQLKKVMERAVEKKEFMEKYLQDHGKLDANYDAAESSHFAKKPLNIKAEDKTEKNSETSSQPLKKEERQEGYKFTPSTGAYKGKPLTWRNGSWHED